MTESNFRVVLGSCERRGAWTVPPHIDARVTLGNLELDLSEAELGPDTTIDAHVAFGNLEIIVPADVAVYVNVDSLAANVEGARGASELAWSTARRVHVTGSMRFASCEVISVERRGLF